MTDEYGMTKLDAKFFKKVAIIILCVSAVIGIALLTRQSWCNHDFEWVRSESPTCTDYGRKYYECKKCGKSKISIVGNPEHEFSEADREDKKENGDYYSREIQTCEKCRHTQVGEWENKGNFNEYAAKMCTAVWLASDGFGSVLDIDNAVVSESGGKYIVAGKCFNILDKKNHSVVAFVRISREEMTGNHIEKISSCGETIYGHIYYLSMDGETVIDEEG